MKVYIFDKVYDGFDLKDSLDVTFLYKVEGKFLKVNFL